MLFKGAPAVPRQAAKGLAWLTIAKESAAPDVGWIADTYKSAVAQATQDAAEAGRILE